MCSTNKKGWVDNDIIFSLKKMSEECVTRLDWLNKTGTSFTVLQTSTYNNHVKLIIKDTNAFGRCIQNSLVSDRKMTYTKTIFWLQKTWKIAHYRKYCFMKERKRRQSKLH